MNIIIYIKRSLIFSLFTYLKNINLNDTLNTINKKNINN